MQVTSNDPKALAEGWNGDAWQLQHAVAPPGATYNELERDLLRIGEPSAKRSATHYDSAGNQDILAESWNGQKWTIQSVPDPAQPERFVV